MTAASSRSWAQPREHLHRPVRAPSPSSIPSPPRPRPPQVDDYRDHSMSVTHVLNSRFGNSLGRDEGLLAGGNNKILTPKSVLEALLASLTVRAGTHVRMRGHAARRQTDARLSVCRTGPCTG